MRAWDDFLSELDIELGKETVQKWLRTLKVIRFDACNLYLEAADAFKILWFEEHIRHRIQKSLVNNNNKKIKVHIAVAASAKIEEKPIVKKGDPSAPQFRLSFDELDEKCQFDQFITGDGNILGFKILSEAALSDAKNSANLSFNPIYIFGRSGTGKTHLLQSTASTMKKKGLKALYIRAETFTEHVVNAIRTGEMQAFRKVYRNIDALLVDDIEIFSKKNATQEEFFHTFNTLHVEGKQIVLSASCTPQELKFIEPRLISRFEWGIVVPIQRLEKEKLRALLLKKADHLKFALAEDVLDFLIATFGINTSSLLRALEALILRTHINKDVKGKAMTLHLAKHILSDLIAEEEKALLTPTKIIKTVAEYYGIRMEDILSKAQSRECALPRQIAMHLCRTKLNLPYMKIGDIFSRDHSTVMSSIKQVQKGVEEKNSELSSSVNFITKRLDHN